MVEQDSTELKVLCCAFGNLVSTISVESILPEARSTELITVRDYENCKAERTEYKQAELLMKFVEKAVTIDTGNFNKFLSILERCQQKSIAEYLRNLNRSMMLAKIQQPGARVYLPEELRVVDKLTFLKTAFSKLLTDFKRSVQQALDSCSKPENEDFISSLQNDLDSEDFTDFQSGYRLVTGDVSLFNIQHLRCVVRLLPEKYRKVPDQLLTDYEAELHDFMKGTAVDEYKTYCEEHLLELISSSVEPISMKLSDIWRRRTLKDLKLLTCKLLKVPGSRLHLHVITEDCVAVHWLCPVSVIPALREAIVTATDALKLEEINQTFIGQEPIMDQPGSSQESYRSVMRGQMTNIIKYTSQLPMAMMQGSEVLAMAASKGTRSFREHDPLNTAPEMRNLLNKVAATASDKWERVGLQLNISPDNIKSISKGKGHFQDSILCYVEVFDMWRKSGSSPYTWATIIDALRAPSVGEHQLANELQEWLTNQ